MAESAFRVPSKENDIATACVSTTVPLPLLVAVPGSPPALSHREFAEATIEAKLDSARKNKEQHLLARSRDRQHYNEQTAAHSRRALELRQATTSEAFHRFLEKEMHHDTHCAELEAEKRRRAEESKRHKEEHWDSVHHRFVDSERQLDAERLSQYRHVHPDAMSWKKQM